MITDRIGSYIAYGLAVIAILFGVSQCGAKDGARHDLKIARQIQAETDMRLATCSGNVSALRDGVAAQNIAVGRLRDESDARIAAADKLAQSAEKGRISAEAKSRSFLSKPPIGADVCQRVLSVDDKFKDALK